VALFSLAAHLPLRAPRSSFHPKWCKIARKYRASFVTATGCSKDAHRKRKNRDRTTQARNKKAWLFVLSVKGRTHVKVNLDGATMSDCQ
jgi:hypothetical protein